MNNFLRRNIERIERVSFKKLLLLGIFPFLFYLLSFVILDYPNVFSFSRFFFLIQPGDGFENAWNLWWVRYSILELHQSPWFTHHLHAPHGLSLISHAFSPFNGFLGILLRTFLSSVETYNFIVVFSFVMGGCAAFYLSYTLTGRVAGSLIAGWIFTFSHYHFAHAQSHLNLTALEWIPLFLVFWWKFCTRPSKTAGLFSGFMLFLVLLCDYYYFLFCCMSAFIILLRQSITTRSMAAVSECKRRHAFFIFCLVMLVAAGPIIIQFINLWMTGGVLIGHDPKNNSLDLISLFVPGSRSRYLDLTRSFLKGVRGTASENNLYFGYSVIVLVLTSWFQRRRIVLTAHGLWVSQMIFFLLMSFGPVFEIGGKEIPWLIGPYGLLERVIPILKSGGCPGRMMVMTMLFAGILSGAAFEWLWKKGSSHKALATFLLFVLFLEYLPLQLQLASPAIPRIVMQMTKLDGGFGMIELGEVFNEKETLYYQTFHHLPMFKGHISRVPQSIDDRDQEIQKLIDSNNWRVLCEDFGFRYVLIKRTNPALEQLETETLIGEANEILLYDIGARTNCRQIVQHRPIEASE